MKKQLAGTEKKESKQFLKIHISNKTIQRLQIAANREKTTKTAIASQGISWYLDNLESEDKK